MLRAKGKDHKQYEYGSKASIASTAQGNLIVGVVSHEQNLHDSYTLPAILHYVEATRGKAAKQAVCDRGYRGNGKSMEPVSCSQVKHSNRIIATSETKSASSAKDAQQLNPSLAI